MAHHGVLLDGALELLENIRQSIPDARVHIITNGVTRNACGRIASTGLNEYLSGVFVSEQLGTAKPAREFFDAVIKAVGEPAESCLVIGDSLTSDMLGAKNADLSSCWFMPQGDIESAVKEYDINYTASSFDELFGIIKIWADK
jgi:2-haloacid dehalogenase